MYFVLLWLGWFVLILLLFRSKIQKLPNFPKIFPSTPPGLSPWTPLPGDSAPGPIVPQSTKQNYGPGDMTVKASDRCERTSTFALYCRDLEKGRKSYFEVFEILVSKLSAR